MSLSLLHQKNVDNPGFLQACESFIDLCVSVHQRICRGCPQGPPAWRRHGKPETGPSPGCCKPGSHATVGQVRARHTRGRTYLQRGQMVGREEPSGRGEAGTKGMGPAGDCDLPGPEGGAICRDRCGRGWSLQAGGLPLPPTQPPPPEVVPGGACSEARPAPSPSQGFQLSFLAPHSQAARRMGDGRTSMDTLCHPFPTSWATALELFPAPTPPMEREKGQLCHAQLCWAHHAL